MKKLLLIAILAPSIALGQNNQQAVMDAYGDAITRSLANHVGPNANNPQARAYEQREIWQRYNDIQDYQRKLQLEQQIQRPIDININPSETNYRSYPSNSNTELFRNFNYGTRATNSARQ